MSAESLQIEEYDSPPNPLFTITYWYSCADLFFYQGSQSGSLFSGLMEQKRGSQDAAAQARRQSFNEQKPQAGFLGNMWNKYVPPCSMNVRYSYTYLYKLTCSPDLQRVTEEERL
jgi:hypothetical protein